MLLCASLTHFRERAAFYSPLPLVGEGLGVRAMPLIITRLIQRPHPCPSPARGGRVLTAHSIFALTAQMPSFCTCGKRCFLLPPPAGGRGAGGEGNAVIIPRLFQRPHPCPSPANGRRVLTACSIFALTSLLHQRQPFRACGKRCFLLPSPTGGRGGGGEGNAVNHSTADPMPSSLPFSRVREKGSDCKFYLRSYCANASNCAPSVT